MSDSSSSTEPAYNGFVLNEAFELDNVQVSSSSLNDNPNQALESKKNKKKAGKRSKKRASIIDYSSTDED